MAADTPGHHHHSGGLRLCNEDLIFVTDFTYFSLKECVYCENMEKGNICVPYEEHIPALGLNEVTGTKEEENGPPLSHKN